ncbi:EAL domain-containing protein [Labrenzia sp. CE80]|uniref:EAL domain-containing protein n=1 Tax=Labrenzia sp. CE80 TaxID=1788986 RepID=UPI00129BA688|nr:EAL domain-containing protein [Labrenzia sp. CE80]
MQVTQDRRLDGLKTWILDLAERLAQTRYLISVQRGLALSLPLIMVGAVALLLRSPPFPTPSFFHAELFIVFCDTLIASTFGIASLITLIGFSTTFTVLYASQNYQRLVNPAVTTMVVLSCFFVAMSSEGTNGFDAPLSLENSLLTALFTATISAPLFLYLSQIPRIRLPLGAFGDDPLVGDVFLLMPAAIGTVFLFALGKFLLVATVIPDLDAALDNFLASLPSKIEDGLLLALTYEFFAQALWFFGLHGPNVLYPVQEAIFTPASDANINAAASGLEPPYAITTMFFAFFARFGGSGSTLCLIFALLIAGRSSNSRRFALVALVPGIFNVNEPLIYGIPLVLNPVYVIPMLVTPLVQTFIAYATIILEWMPPAISRPTWTTPVLFSGYLATGSISGTLVQAFSLTVGTLLYIPFVRISEQVTQQRSSKLLKSLMLRVANSSDATPQSNVIEYHGPERRLANVLSRDLEMALRESKELFLEYQPQINVSERRLSGAEALLRWNHPLFGPISPPLIIALAEENGQMDELGYFVLREACAMRAEWRYWLADECCLAVNVSPRQLKDPNFCANALAIIRKSGLTPEQIELEITETGALLPDKQAVQALHDLRLAGIRIALDDFGMGHTSIHYLKELPLDTIKIDRSLTNVALNKANELIVKSILELGVSMDISVMVEGIEEEEQLERFLSLGCTTFQGYLFSKPIPGYAFPSFAQSLYLDDAKQQWQPPTQSVKAS